MKPIFAAIVLFGLVGCDDSPEPGWVGLSHTYVKPADVKRLGLKNESGARVSKVAEGGPAEKAGIEVDDVIFAFHGKKIASPVVFAKAIEGVPAGKAYAVAVYRGNKVVEVEIVTAPKPD